MNEQTSLPLARVNVTIDGKTISVPKGTTVYKAAKQLGIQIPIFCYQDRMPPFGACRMCLVEVEKMPKLQTSCTLEATDGMFVNTASHVATEGRKSIIELLLINHPLDCPICDRGGECPLQDQALSDGPGESRFFEDKRKFKKPIPLGSVLMLDRERCIVCARCTRFGEIIAGDYALEFKERGYKTEVGTPNGKPVESKFIGNTIQICPVGALTSQVYRFRARPWDNQSTMSTCTLCPVGCSKIIDSRDGEIMRMRSMENPAVNDIWLCDKGWFGYEYVAHPHRLQKPLIRRHGILEEATYEEAFDLIVAKFKQAKLNQKMAAFGGNTLTVEENFLFQKLFRSGFGVNHLDHRIGEPLFSFEQEGMQAGMEISIEDCEQLSNIWLLGCDLTEEFPVIWLRLKQAINNGAKMSYIGHFEPEIGRYLSDIIVHEPGNELEILKRQLELLSKNNLNKKQCALFVGTQYLRSPLRGLILKLLSQYQEIFSINIMEGRGNSVGARFAGMRPDILPGGWPNQVSGFNALEVLQKTCREGWDILYVAGANPALKFPTSLWKKARGNLDFLVVQDLFLTETAQDADVVLPALTYVEKWGSFITIEGRLQKLRAGKEVPETIFSDGEIFNLLAQKLEVPLEVDKDFSAKLKSEKIVIVRASSNETNSPMNSLLSDDSQGSGIVSDAEMTSLNSSRLKASFSYQLFDQGVRMEHNPHVRELSKEPYARIHPLEVEKRKLTDGDYCTLQSGEQHIYVKIKVDPGVAENTIVLPLGFKNFPVYDLSNQLFNGLEIAIQRGA